MLKIDICFHVGFQNYHIKNKIFIFFKIQLIIYVFLTFSRGFIKNKTNPKGTVGTNVCWISCGVSPCSKTGRLGFCSSCKLSHMSVHNYANNYGTNDLFFFVSKVNILKFKTVFVMLIVFSMLFSSLQLWSRHGTFLSICKCKSRHDLLHVKNLSANDLTCHVTIFISNIRF